MDEKTVIIQKEEGQPVLHLFDRSGHIRDVRLQGRQIFGRETSSVHPDIPVNAQIISKRHGEFGVVEGQTFYRDLGSTNGTRINGANLYADKGEIFTLTAVVTPKDADDQSVTWSSDNSAVASVDASGKVSVRGYGSAGITVRTVDGNYSAWVTVVVEQPEPPTAAPPASLSVDNAYFSSYSASGSLSSYARVELQGISASGDTVTANFMLCNCEGLTSGDVVLRYDSSVLQCTGVSYGSDAAAIRYDVNEFSLSTNYTEIGKVYFGFYFNEELYEQGGWDTYVNSSQFHACTLTFRITDSRVSAADAVAALMTTAYLQ